MENEVMAFFLYWIQEIFIFVWKASVYGPTLGSFTAVELVKSLSVIIIYYQY